MRKKDGMQVNSKPTPRGKETLYFAVAGVVVVMFPYCVLKSKVIEVRKSQNYNDGHTRFLYIIPSLPPSSCSRHPVVFAITLLTKIADDRHDLKVGNVNESSTDSIFE